LRDDDISAKKKKHMVPKLAKKLNGDEDTRENEYAKTVFSRGGREKSWGSWGRAYMRGGISGLRGGSEEVGGQGEKDEGPLTVTSKEGRSKV